MQHNDPYFKSALGAAATRTYRAAVRFGLSRADREDLHQELILDLLERANQFDPSKGSAGTFTGVVSEHRTCDFLNAIKKDRARLSFCSGEKAANDLDISGAVASGDTVIPLWAQDQDLFCESETLRDLETAVAYMSDEQQALFALLDTHEDLPGACRVSGVSTATFYRRVNELRMHLRMFGFPAAV